MLWALAAAPGMNSHIIKQRVIPSVLNSYYFPFLVAIVLILITSVLAVTITAPYRTAAPGPSRRLIAGDPTDNLAEYPASRGY